MISPQGYQFGKDPKSKNPFWGQGEDSNVNRIFATASVDENTGTPQVQTSKSVSGGDITFNFAFKNLKGERGETGQQGPQGVQGIQGIQGLQGETGPRGATGEAGPVGPVGPQGPIGETGAQGETGPKGDTGAQGPQGPAGNNGSDGADGFSPTIAVTDITGGHRVTITDKDGPHTFDVMDGDGAGTDYVMDWDEESKSLTMDENGDGTVEQTLELTGIAMLDDIGTRTFSEYDITTDNVQTVNTDLQITSGRIVKVKLNDDLCLVFYACDFNTTTQVTFSYHEVTTLIAKFRPPRVEALQGWLGLTNALCNINIGSSGRIAIKFGKSETVPTNTPFYVTGTWLTHNMEM